MVFPSFGERCVLRLCYTSFYAVWSGTNVGFFTCNHLPE